MTYFTSNLSIFAVSLLFLFISIFLRRSSERLPYQTHSSTSPPISASGLQRNQSFVRRNHIIRFLGYEKAEDHRKYLQESVKFEGWEWIERKNPAAKFPTDFGLVAIEDAKRDVLIGKFESLELVKDVSVDLSYKVGLLEEKGNKNGGKVGAFVDGKKRPGKIFTSMSFSEMEENHHAVASTSNMTIRWNRNLLMQV